MPDLNAYTGDAFMRVDDEATWTAARGANSAETLLTTQDKNNSAVKASANATGTQYDCYRYFAGFDTSAITVKPTSAVLKLYGYLGTNVQIVVVRVQDTATGGASADYIASDFKKVDTVAYSAEYTDSWSTVAYNEITLNDDALNDMLSLSNFRIAVIDNDYDFGNSAPPNGTSRNTGWYSASSLDNTKVPIITYVEGVSGPTYAESTASSLISDSNIISSFNSNVLGNQFSREVEQVPFSLGVRGPRHLRGRTTSYNVSIGGKQKK